MRVRASRAVGGLLALVMWTGATLGLQGSILDLIVFTAPSAALGLLAAWASQLATRDQFSWSSGLAAVGWGAALLTPVLAALIALVGPIPPDRQLWLFVLVAWCVLISGVTVGVAANLLERLRSRWNRGSAHGAVGALRADLPPSPDRRPIQPPYIA